MKLSLYNLAGDVVGDVELSDAVFGVEPNVPLMHQAVLQHLANARVGTASTKTRAEVAGTTKKMYRQKGTGRARHGSRKVNLWTGGGVAHGPHPRSYEQQMPKKMRRQAIRSALSVKARDNQIVVLNEISFERPRTKEMLAVLGRLPVSGKVLLTLDQPDETVVLSLRNIPGVDALPATALNTRDLLRHDYLVATLPAIRAVEEWLSTARRRANGADAEAGPTAEATQTEPAEAPPNAEAAEARRTPRARRTPAAAQAPAPESADADQEAQP